MPLLTERTVAIDCPADATYAYVADLERFGEWFPGVIAIVSANAPTGAASCRVTWRMSSRNDGVLVRLLLVPLARRIVGRRAIRGVAVLKRILEGGRGT